MVGAIGWDRDVESTEARSRVHRRISPPASAIALTLLISALCSSAIGPVDAAEPDDLRVAVVADSIGWDFDDHWQRLVSPQIARDHDLVVYHAVPAGLMDEQRAPVRDRLQQAGGVDALVVMLGTADSTHVPSAAVFRRRMRSFLDAVTPQVPCVRWVNLKGSDGHDYYRFFNLKRRWINDSIDRVAAEYDEVEVAAYSTFSQLVPDPYYSLDLLHPSSLGKIALGEWLSDVAASCADGDLLTEIPSQL